ncbi:hypothetical protein [Edwardsiella anguillarum]|uniref:hypothetical protein n=1 Tax=Edwardsiella anguillarum TaxID=1821960 RepID=UPI0024B6FEF5|nr:hypothetical protein [Edwardsiella anguillarum]WHQ14811.1 hypothetical protein MQ083_03210 [Edwardsiella anguillarum]
MSSSLIIIKLDKPPLRWGSIGFAASRDKMQRAYASLDSYTGIFTAKGGFDITVDNHTLRDGRLSPLPSGGNNNRLETGTRGWADIRNESETSDDRHTVAMLGRVGGGGDENRNVMSAICTVQAEDVHRQISKYIGDKQATARLKLKEALDCKNEVKRQWALEDIYNLRYQRRLFGWYCTIYAENYQ